MSRRSLANVSTNALALEIARQQAESLGRAGRKLQDAIEKFDSMSRDGGSAAALDRLSSEIASRAWALMVQRELVGFRHEAVRWVLDRFHIPDAALSKLGRPRDAPRGMDPRAHSGRRAAD